MRGTAAATSTRRVIVEATERVVAALEEYAAVVGRQDMELGLLALPAGLENIARYALAGQATEDAQDLAAAWRVVDEDLPVAPAAPLSELGAEESYRRWRGPLRPRALLDRADLASREDRGYREQSAANDAYFAARDARKSVRRTVRCGRPTRSGDPCATTPTYVPPGGFEQGFPCWRHLSGAEKVQVRACYNMAVSGHDCPGCVATHGQECVADEVDPALQRIVEGGSPRARTFEGRKVHEVRLDLAPIC